MSLRDQLRTLPAEALVPVGWVRDQLDTDDPEPDPPALAVMNGADDWPTRIWIVPPETRLGVREVAAAARRGEDWVYRAVSPRRAAEKGREPLPHRKIDGLLSFTAGEVREWLQRSEVEIAGGAS